MKNSVRILVLIVLVGAVATFLMVFSDKKPENETSFEFGQMGMEATDFPRDSQEQKYISFTQEAFDTTESERRVLFFYANWCPTCRPADADISKNLLKLPESVTLFRVNYEDNETSDEEKKLAETYGITYQHTFVEVDKSGKAVRKWNGGGLEEILRNLEGKQ